MPLPSPPSSIVVEDGPYYAVGSGNNGPQLCVLLHGLGGDSYELSPLGRALHNHGYSVLGLRYPGHGLDETKLPYSEWQSWAAHALNEITAVAHNHSRITLIGFSTGGPLAIYLNQHLAVHAIVLLAPFFGLRHRAYYGFRPETWLSLTQPLVTHILAPPLPITCRNKRKKAESFRRYRWFNLPLINSAQQLISTIQPLLPHVTAPLLWVYSTNDTVVCNNAARQALSAVNSTIKHEVSLNQGNHIVCRDIDSDPVIEHVLHFLKCVTTPPILIGDF